MGKSEVCSELYQISKTECFTKIVNDFLSLTTFAKRSILNVLDGSEYVFLSFIRLLIN